MSFDLYIWSSREPVTSEGAQEVFRLLADGLDDAVEPDARVLALHRELIERYPPLEKLDDTRLESSPWSMSPDVTDHRAILCMRHSSAAEASLFVLELVKRHGLVCFDPQSGHVRQPDPTADLRLESGDGSRVANPTRQEVRRALEALSDDNWYVCLEREPGWFVQVGIGAYAGDVPAGRFALESREGSPERHVRTLVDSFEVVADAFEGFAAGDDSWKRARSWDLV